MMMMVSVSVVGGAIDCESERVLARSVGRPAALGLKRRGCRLDAVAPPDSTGRLAWGSLALSLSLSRSGAQRRQKAARALQQRAGQKTWSAGAAKLNCEQKRRRRLRWWVARSARAGGRER